MAVIVILPDPKPEMWLQDFIGLVKREYTLAQRGSSPSMKKKRTLNWESGSWSVEDENGKSMRQRLKFKAFEPHKCHILRLHDGSSAEISDTFENMWDLTPDTELLRELPEEYTFETALADLIDNSLQAVWSNGENGRKRISVDIMKDKISIFDTGPGMDASDENSIVKWGKMGASLHRSFKAKAIGVKPPYLIPYFGMFGYGGPIATMQLGRRALVSSKTKESKKVYTLHLEREALLRSSGSEPTWKTSGGMRDPSEDEIGKSSQGSFTKVEILEPKVRDVDIFQLQCKLKDIYFPYIQCDEVSKSGKTTRPVEFQVNGVDLAEIDGGEVSITNLHSCNGPEFIFQLHFSIKQDVASTRSSGSRASQEANARIKCVYFPISEGKENIEKILENLKDQGCGNGESFETFTHVSIRRLGRLLPDARWACHPFMEFKQKKGDKAHILKRCCLRVKCFIETDAGFNPTPSKTDLAHHNPFTIALKNFSHKMPEKEKAVNVDISRDDKMLSFSHLEKEYEEWILEMHSQYDTEVGAGEDDEVLVVGPTNKIPGISSDVVRVRDTLTRKGTIWKRGQKIKVLKGAGPGFHNKNVYLTLEHILIEGVQGDAGGGACIICRPLDIAEENGCVLSVKDGELDIRSSISIPISVIDSGKCQTIGSSEWNCQLQKQVQKAPSTIEVLGRKHCRELGIDGLGFPAESTVEAGCAPPAEIVQLFGLFFIFFHHSKSLDQKYIAKTNLEMSIEVKIRKSAEECQNIGHIYSARVAPSWLSRALISSMGTLTASSLSREASNYDEVSMQQSLLFSDSLKDLKNLRSQLYSAAEYFELSYTNDDQKQIGGNIEDYAIKALVNTVDHLGSVTYKVNDLLDEKVDERLRTCQEYIDHEGISQQSLVIDTPKYPKRYILPVGETMHGAIRTKSKYQGCSLDDEDDWHHLGMVAVRATIREAPSSARETRYDNLKLHSLQKGTFPSPSPRPPPQRSARFPLHLPSFHRIAFHSCVLALCPSRPTTPNTSRPTTPSSAPAKKRHPCVSKLKRKIPKTLKQYPSKSKRLLKALLSRRKSKKDEMLYTYLDEY
ncbi:Gamma-irradiation and mitomycin induced [Salix suchowensis]|nr:Gamma-irradiation and mitomycin induced [Salix suchowensis]